MGNRRSREGILKFAGQVVDNLRVVAVDRARERALEEPGRVNAGDESAGPTARGRGAVARVLAFAALLVAGTVAALVWGPLARAPVIRHLAPEPVATGLLVVLFALVNLTPLSIRFRGQVSLVVLWDVPLLLGLVMVTPRTLVLSWLLSDAVVYGLVRRQAYYKLVFNLAQSGLAAVLSALAYRSVLGSHSVVGTLGWAAAAAALVSATVFARLTLALVLRLHGEKRKLRWAPDSAHMILVLVVIASIALAVVVLDAATLDIAAVGPLLLIGVLVIFAYRRYLGLTDKFGALQQLYEFSRSVGAMSLETSSTVWAILERVLSVMRTRRAELVVIDEPGTAHRLSVDDEGRRVNEKVALSHRSLVARVVTTRQSLLESGRTTPRGKETVRDDVLGEFEEAAAVPISSAEQVIGVLVALDRAPGFAPLNEDDLRLFEALAAHAGTTLERARLVEELRLESEAKTHQATHDELTGLPNRVLFLESAGASLAATGRAAIALLDLDRFKEVNDTLGHGVGDTLLCEISERLLKVAAGRATVARLGGDEFALVIPGVMGPEEATGIVRDIESAISRPVHLAGITLAVTASAGVSLAPEHGNNVATLLQRADIAMYHAKERRSGIEMYSASHDSSMQRKLMLGGQLTEALASGKQLSLVYQPIAKFATGEVVRLEALSRWYHPDHGQVPADEFISIAEQMGLIGQITDFVLREGLRQLATWRAKGYELGLTVNLSGQDLADHSIVRKIASRLHDCGLPPGALSLEVTETEVMADVREASRVLAELGELGVRIALDDFGTGYSSLAYLHSLPLDELKLDRSFVNNIAANESNAIIVRSSIAMAHSLGLSVVAEGAENELTCAMLADAGCDALQGYYLSPPLSAADLTRWLSTKPRLRFAELASAHPLRVLPGRLKGLA